MGAFTRKRGAGLTARFFAIIVFSVITMSVSWGQVYQTNGSGNWGDVGIWLSDEASPGTFAPVSEAPIASNSTYIFIHANHSVTLTEDITVDRLEIAAGGTLTVPVGKTLTVTSSGNGEDLKISGTLLNEGTVIEDGSHSSDNLFVHLGGVFHNKGSFVYDITYPVFEEGSWYIHESVNPFPWALWNINSNVEVRAISSLGNISFNEFGNFVWNTSALSEHFYLDNNLSNNVKGDLTVMNTNSKILYFGSSTADENLSIGGDFIVNGATASVAFPRDGDKTIDINGDLSVIAGKLNLSPLGLKTKTINLNGNFNLAVAGEINLVKSAIANINFIGNENGAEQIVALEEAIIGGTVSYRATNTTISLPQGNYLSGSGSFTLDADATLKVGSTSGIVTGTSAGNIRVSGVRTFTAGSTIEFNGTAAQVTGSGFPTTGDVNVKITNASGVTLTNDLTINAGRSLTLNGGSLTVGSKKLTVLGSTSGTGNIVTNNTSSVAFNGDGAVGTINLSSGVVKDFTLNRTSTASTGSATLNSDLQVTGALTLTNGTLIINDRTLTLAGTASFGSGKLSGNTNSKVNITGSGTFGSIAFDPAGNTIGELTVARNDASAATVSGSLTVNSALNLSVGTLSASGLTMANGSTLTRNQGALSSAPATSGSYNVVYTGGVTTGVELPTSTTALKDLTINTTGNTVTLNSSPTVNGSFAISQGSFVQGANTLTVKGNFDYNGDSYSTTGGVVLSGSASQAISAGSAISFRNLTVNNTAGVVLNSNNITVDGALTLTAGKLITNANTLTLGSAATISESVGNYVVGSLSTTRTVGAGPETFGGMGVELSGSNLSELGDVTVVRTSGSAGALTLTGEDNKEYGSINRKWKITPLFQPTEGASVNVTLRWISDDDNGKDIADVKVWKTQNTESDFKVAGEQPGGTREVTVQVGSFSTFAVTPRTPLPVELLYFEAKRKGNAAELTWATASEKDNTGFEVQVSDNAKDFRVLGFVETQNGNSLIVQKYAFVDKEAGKNGIRYYRIKQIDVDGTEEIFTIKAVQFDEAAVTVNAFPNPFLNDFEVVVNANGSKTIHLSLTDLQGKKAYEKTITAEAGMNRIPVELQAEVASGIYILQVTTDKMKKSLKVVKE